MTERAGNHPHRSRQRGTITILVAFGLLSLLAVLGLAINSGQLYVTKSELQSAADSCALAAAREIVCDSATATGGCPNSLLVNASLSGTKAAQLHRQDFQKNGIKSENVTVLFNNGDPTILGNYQKTVGAQHPSFAQCVVTSPAVAPLLQTIAGVTTFTIQASAVATMVPSQGLCSNVPIGICKPTSPSTLTEKAWIESAYDPGNKVSTSKGKTTTTSGESGLTGGFQWADLTGTGFTDAKLKTQLLQTAPVCSGKVALSSKVSNAEKIAVRDAYNTVFGIMPSSNFAAIPDATGYSFPTGPVNLTNNTFGSAYKVFLDKRTTNAPFDDTAYTGTKFAKGQATILTQKDLQNLNGNRRLRVAPIVDCTAPTPNVTELACVLLLNPIDNNNGSKSEPVYLQYLGLANKPGSPCSSSGVAGGLGSKGPLVPTLVM